MNQERSWIIESSISDKSNLIFLFVFGTMGAAFMAFSAYISHHPEWAMAHPYFFYPKYGPKIVTQDSIDLNRLVLSWFGAFLILTGAAIYLFSNEITVNVDPRNKTLGLRKRTRLGHRFEIYHFDEIEKVVVSQKALGRARRKSDLFVFYKYELEFQMKNSRVLRIGKSSRQEHEMSELAERLAATIDCGWDSISDKVPFSESLQIAGYQVDQIALAAFISIACYFIWYRLNIGPLTEMQWCGPGSILIPLLLFIPILNTLRRIHRK